VHGRDGAEIDDDRGQILIRHHAIIRVRHEGKKRAPVMTNTFADSAGQLVVSPIARAGFRVRCDIGWDDTAGKTRQGKLCVTSARCPRDQRCVVLFPVMFAVATKAVTKRLFASRRPWLAVTLNSSVVPPAVSMASTRTNMMTGTT
jgi:hypothetical protein